MAQNDNIIACAVLCQTETKLFGMLVSVLVLFLIIWVLLYYQVRDVFAPWSITALIWIGVIGGYLAIDHGLYKVTDQFSIGILLWVPIYCASSYVMFRLTPSNQKSEWAVNGSIVRGLTILALLLTPYTVYKAVSFAVASGSGNLMYTMREQIIDKDSGFSLGPLAYFVHVIYTLLFVSADVKSKVNKLFFVFCMMLNLCFFFVVMSKLILFIGFLSTLYLFYIHKKVRIRTIVLLCVLFAALGILFTQIRTTSDGDSEATFTLMELLSMYILSPIVAFGYDVGNTSAYFGEETLRPLYHILHAFGLTHVEAGVVDRPYVYVPIPTNVYTMMDPFFNDFGFAGIAFFALVEGAVVGWIYKKAFTGQTIARGVYAYLVAVIALQFFDEQFFLGISNIIQMTLLIAICHIKFVWKPQSRKLFW